MRRNTVNCHSPRFLAGIALALMTSASAGGGVVWLDELEIVNIETGWRQVERNRSVSQQPLRIGGEMFERGAGVHAVSLAEIALDGRAQRFSASVGVDDVMSGKGSVEFLVVGDGMVLWRSGVMHGGDAARPVHVELSGVRKLQLKVEDGGDGIGQDHANWAMARFEVDGAPPRILGFDDTPIPDLPISPTNRSAARAALIPYPRQVAWQEGKVALSEAAYELPAGCETHVERTLREVLEQAGCDATHRPEPDEPGVSGIVLTFGEVPGSDGKEEAYRLVAAGERVEIAAPNNVGLFYAVQTLRQLMQSEDGEVYVPCCEITDWPAFRYRGLMHDVGRNFQSIEFLKRQMNLLARYKLNVFHWHLTDNPGYRIECKKYPQLNDPKNYRSTRNPGRFYTYDEINAFIEYCRKRHILVIPEIDMPGHSEYFTNTFGVEMQAPKGAEILADILNEFFDHVDLPWFHLGSDEVRIKNPDFMPRMAGIVRDRGKQAIVWRPGNMPDDDVITQLWIEATPPVPGVRVLDSRATYVNHMDPLAGIHRIYMMKPGRGVPDPDLVLGGILCHWPDNNIEGEERTLQQSPVVPALVTYAERIWRGAENDRRDLYARMAQPGTKTLQEFVEFERDLLVHRDRLADEGWPFPYVRQTDIPWRLIGPFDHEGDFNRAFGPEEEIRDAYVVNGRTHLWKERVSIGGTIHINHFFDWRGHMPKRRSGTVYALTYVHSDRDQPADFWIQFGTPSTSARRSGGNPPPGQWSQYHGRIWINGEEIAPPKWNNPGLLGSRAAEKEIAFTNECYHYREPTKVRLKKGWNQVLLRVPFGNAAGYRGGKWMFTCVPIRWGGRQARELDGVVFSTSPGEQKVTEGPAAEVVDHARLVPADKQLDAGWVRSLFERGEPTIYRGDELAKIGMPVGGICAGNVYLGGDGKLWLWDIFNQHHEGCVARDRVEYRGSKLRERDGANYVDPPEQQAPFDLSFFLDVDDRERPLDRTGWKDVSFLGQYPVGTVDYRDGGSPVSVRLEAFSPFVPLQTDDSGLPATVLRYTITNESDSDVQALIGGRIENPVLVYSSARVRVVQRRNTVRWQPGLVAVECTVHAVPAAAPGERGDIVFDDFEQEMYEGWTVEGTAFGTGPLRLKDMPKYQGDVNGRGERVVNTHNVRQGEDVRAGDQHTGTLTSREFTIERRYVNFRIGGGDHPGQTCLNLLVDGQVVRSATGHNGNRMRLDFFEVSDLKDQRARLQIVDQCTEGWGNIGVDDIVFSDAPCFEKELEELPDYGSMCLAVIGDDGRARPSVAAGTVDTETAALNEPLIGEVSRHVALEPGETRQVTFVVTWYFPNVAIPGLQDVKRWYSSRFIDAGDVARYVARNLDRLAADTLSWRDTWYDSTLPHWFLDRTFANTSTLATNTCHRFADGRFWCWEGIGCCPGTCTHVWGYAQAVGRLYPELEHYLREEIDFGRFFHEDTGAIDYRGEFARHVAHDGQAGCILRAYREHLMSPDNSFLRRRWSRIRKAIEFLIREDGNDDGLLEGAQYNTLDASWYGPMGWLSSLYLAAVRAGEEMATEMGDAEFAQRCRTIAERGGRNLVARVFNGEYFIHIPDPQHPEANSTNDGCHIDQVYGQSWAHQVGLGRIIPEKETKSALASLWKYNFAPDVGRYRNGMKVIKGGRWYAVPGEAGLLMCTFPKGGAERATGRGRSAWAAMYFNECMTGFEYQVAGHMIWEGLLTEGLAITRAIHDRYGASRRNPYNEIECSDHYARAMASYGVFLAACGFEYHGPKGYLAFSPRLSPEDFRAAFTAAEGWGTLGQRRDAVTQREFIEVKWGRLRLRTLAFDLPDGAMARRIQVTVAGRPVEFTHETEGRRVKIALAGDTVIHAGESMEIKIAL